MGREERAEHVARDRHEWLALALILALAAALRLYHLGSLPPGMFYDEAVYGTFAVGVLEGNRPIFFTLPDGREPLYIYTLALAFSVFGPSALLMRLVSVGYGLLTVAATYLLAREVFGRRVGLLATLVLAIILWHVSLSRLALRVVTVPLFECLAAYFLWRGARRGQLLGYALGGAALGAGLYTYISARAAPIWLGGFALLLAIPAWRPGLSLRRHALGVALFVATAATVFAPLGLFFLQNPEAFTIRTRNVDVIAAEGANPPEGETLATSVLKTAGLFVVEGDNQVRHNLPRRPAFDPFLAASFLLGLAVALRRVYRPRYALPLLWLGVMLLPGALSVQAPHFLRTSGALPAACVVAALGLDALWRLALALPRPALRRAGLLLIALGLTFSLGATARDYFVAWAGRADVTYAFDADQTTARCLAGQLAGQGSVLMAMPPQLAWAITQRRCPSQGEPVRMFDGRSTLVVPGSSAARDLYYVYPHTYTPEGGRQCAYLPCAEPYAVVRDPEGGSAVQVFRTPADLLLWPPPAHRLVARIGQSLDVLGYDAGRLFAPGDVVRFTAHLRIVAPFREPGEWKLFANLVDESGRNWASAHGELLMPDSWQAGDLYLAWLDLSTPKSLPPGLYQVQLGVFDNRSLGRQRIVDADGRDVGDVLTVGPLRAVEGAVVPPAPPGHALGARLGDRIRLLGYDLPAEARAGQPVRVALHWQASSPLEDDYTVFVHLLDAAGKLVAQDDARPLGGRLPTPVWAPGEVVVDPHEVSIGQSLQGQTLRVVVGLYRPETDQRLPTLDPSGAPAGDSVSLGTLQVR